MKTVTKKIEVPQLKIEYDQDAESPRNWDNLGYFITIDRKYNSPDKDSELIAIVKSTGDEAESQKEHIELTTKAINESGRGEKVLAIYPVVKYEHSGVVYSLGQKAGFDYSNNGFYIITDKTAKEAGIEPKDFEETITREIEQYNKWANGEVYCITLYDEDGEVQEQQGEFYSFEDIASGLPKEFEGENLQDYFIKN